MELTVMERLQAIGCIKDTGDIVFLRVRDALIRKLGLSEEELEKFEAVTNRETGNVTWNPNVPQETEIDLTKMEIGMIREGVEKLNREHTLTANHMTLYEKFVENKPGD